MIFYFSAIGNSQYAAEKISDATNARLVSIGRSLRDEQFDFDLTQDDYLGFVVPTLACTLPAAVEQFVHKLNLAGYAGQYVYGVFAGGAGSGSESAALGTLLREKSIGYNGSFDLVMPGNFIIRPDVPSPAKLESMLNNVDKQLEGIIASIRAKKDGLFTTRAPKDLCTPMEASSASEKTGTFYATDVCTACGLCMGICPTRCIRPDGNGRPLWEGACMFCLACLRHCPTEAIQYSRNKLNKRPYINPKVNI